MIFGGFVYDDGFKKWFAWRPVKLSGPMEWDRCKVLGCKARWAWLRIILRRRSMFGTDYALPVSEDTRANVKKMLRFYEGQAKRRGSRK